MVYCRGNMTAAPWGFQVRSQCVGASAVLLPRCVRPLSTCMFALKHLLDVLIHHLALTWNGWMIRGAHLFNTAGSNTGCISVLKRHRSFTATHAISLNVLQFWQSCFCFFFVFLFMENYCILWRLLMWGSSISFLKMIGSLVTFHSFFCGIAVSLQW